MMTTTGSKTVQTAPIYADGSHGRYHDGPMTVVDFEANRRVYNRRLERMRADMQKMNRMSNALAGPEWQPDLRVIAGTCSRIELVESVAGDCSVQADCRTRVTHEHRLEDSTGEGHE